MSVKLRTPLLAVLEKGRAIIRFVGSDLPPKVVIDNVHDHILRCFDFTTELKVSPVKKQLLQKMLLIHDLPEIENLQRLGLFADLTAPEKKANPQRAQEVAESEDKVAKEIFTNKEYEIYSQFESGSHYIKQLHDLEKANSLGALAKIIDVVDANLKLHQSLTSWAQTPNYDPILLKENSSLAYAFNFGTAMTTRFNHIEDIEVRAAGLTLVGQHYQAIVRMWGKVKKAQKPLPKEIQKYF